MLVLTRKLQESVVVGAADEGLSMLSITVLEIGGGKVRLGFQADSSIRVHRQEVWLRIQDKARTANPATGRGPPGSD
jgi:carbon storage regulator CsrA